MSVASVLLGLFSWGVSIAAPAASDPDQEEGDWAYAMYTCAPKEIRNGDQMILVWTDQRYRVLSLSTARDGMPWPDYAKPLMQGGAVEHFKDFVKARPGFVVNVSATEVTLPVASSHQVLQCRSSFDE